MRHIVLMLFLLLHGQAVGAAPTASDSSPELALHFEQPGQVCASTAQRQELLLALRDVHIPDDAAITLVAYSDRAEMRDPAWRGWPDCVPRQVPASLVGHDRIALLRAYQVFDLGREAGIAAFARPPLLALGPEAAEAQRLSDPRAVVIVLQRNEGAGPVYRKVEIRWDIPKPKKIDPQGTSKGEPTTATSGVVSSNSGSPPIVWLAHNPPDHSLRRTLGWTSTVVGLAATALGLGFIIAAAVKTHDARDLLEKDRMLALSAQAQDFWIVGGTVLGIGAGLTTAGIVIVRREKEKDGQPAERQVRVTPTGLALNW